MEAFIQSLSMRHYKNLKKSLNFSPESSDNAEVGKFNCIFPVLGNVLFSSKIQINMGRSESSKCVHYIIFTSRTYSMYSLIYSVWFPGIPMTMTTSMILMILMTQWRLRKGGTEKRGQISSKISSKNGKG